MKNLLLTLALFCVFFANAQETKPSKEETIAWIKEKIEDTPQKGISKIKVESINECQIIITYTLIGYSDFRVTIPVTETSCGPGGMITNKGKVIRIQYLDDGEIVLDKYLDVFDFSNIYSRLDKAIKHLATFCNKKPEPF